MRCGRPSSAVSTSNVGKYTCPKGTDEPSAAFDPGDNPLNVPVVQVSLFDSEDHNQHYRLGQAVTALREEGIQIIVSGIAVHNLRDLRFTLDRSSPMPYTTSFDEALRDAVTVAPAQREVAMTALLKRADARQAHPEFDHLCPIFVGAGAADRISGRGCGRSKRAV
ncbi:MAG: hypothetical protein LQ347_001149 [Umbilicaria vellea]|nr:MAG: hypothetical protein LQ347_001149 [Umbilicaria vellea]